MTHPTDAPPAAGAGNLEFLVMADLSRISAGLLARLAARGLIEWSRTGAARGIWPAGLRDRIRGLVGDHS